MSIMMKHVDEKFAVTIFWDYYVFSRVLGSRLVSCRVRAKRVVGETARDLPNAPGRSAQFLNLYKVNLTLKFL